VRAVGDTIELSASDLSEFLSCHHRTALDAQVARDLRAAPSWADPVLAILRERGLEHEQRYADDLRRQGLRISDLAAMEKEQAPSQTLQDMRAGFDLLLQPALHDGRWFGKPDILRRVETLKRGEGPSSSSPCTPRFLKTYRAQSQSASTS
jgi:uncharacterized protein